MEHVKAFSPTTLGTASLTPTTTSSNVAILQTQVGGVSRAMIRMANNTGSIVFIKLGIDNTVVATVVAGMPVMPGSVEVISLKGTDAYLAAILPSGTASGAFYITHGEGI